MYFFELRKYLYIERKNNMKEEFIIQKQEWVKDTRIEVVSKDGNAHCSIVMYPKENVQVLWQIYVSEPARRKGKCKELLDYVDSISERKFTQVYVEPDAPEWLRNMYEKRGYVVRTI